MARLIKQKGFSVGVESIGWWSAAIGSALAAGLLAGTSETGAVPFFQEAPLFALAVAVLVALTIAFARSAQFAVWALLIVAILTREIVPQLTWQMSVAGINIYALDVVTVLMLVVGASRIVGSPPVPSLLIPAILLVILLITHFLWGMSEFDPQTAANGTRRWLYFLGPFIFALCAMPRWTRRSLTPIFAAALILSLFAIVGIFRNGLHAANTFVDIGGQRVDARAVTATGALLMVQCALLIVSGRFAKSVPAWTAVYLMVLAVVLLQHRTVWLVGFVVILAAYLAWVWRQVLTNGRVALAAASAVLVVAAASIAVLVSFHAFTDSVRTATGSRSTLEWRTESWRALTEEHKSAGDVLAGLPAGTSFDRRIGPGSRLVTQSPHNVYVDALLSFGLLGPLILLWLWLLVVLRRGAIATSLGITSLAVVLVVGSCALFGMTNMLGPAQGLLLGCLLQAAYAAGRRTVSVRRDLATVGAE
jgi:hypothetical protein